MGEVYGATVGGAGGFKRDVAVKLIRSDLAGDERFVRAFLREGRSLGRLSHRGIVQVYELEVIDGQPYMAMELLEGWTVRELLSRLGGRLPVEPAVFIVAEVAGALAAAHTLREPEHPRGLMHGDLSPSNVMVCRDGAVKLLDFGLARPVGAGPSTSNVGGKLAYMPPESASGAMLDERVDIYAVGVVLYELLTGTRPLAGRNDLELLQNILHAPVVPPSKRVAGLDPKIDQLILKAIARDRGERYAKASELEQDLRRLLAGRYDGNRFSSWVRSVAPLDEQVPSAATTEGEVAHSSAWRTLPDGVMPLRRPRRRGLALALVAFLAIAQRGRSAAGTSRLNPSLRARLHLRGRNRRWP